MKGLTKTEVYQKELEKITEIFKDVDKTQREIAEGLIQETAYLKSELWDMRQVLEQTGMIKIHPNDPSKQKALPIANEYRRTANIYALNIKTLNGILQKNVLEEEDAFDAWMKAKQNNE